MQAKLNFKDFTWINKPKSYELDEGELSIQTEPGTDFWQRTYYGFRNDNAPAFLTEVEDDFTFTVKTNFNYKNQFDQCGIVLYQDSENWVKASVEYENDKIARLGSVVTNLGYSDWATTDIPAKINGMWYRLSRRSQDFYIECSDDGINFEQMRILHMHAPIKCANIGVYACSPLQSSFKAIFTSFKIEPCVWKLHE